MYSSMECNNEEILSKIGLTNQESRTYLALLKLQESQTGDLCKEVGIASSNIYKILDLLLNKGLISYRVQNNIKIFMPSPPETLNELFLEKQRNLEEERKEIQRVIKNLKTKEVEEEPFSKYKYYEGFISIKSMWHEINTYMNKSMLLKIHTAKKEAYERLVGFYNEHHKIRKQKKIKERMIFPSKDRKLAEIRLKDSFVEIKFIKLKEDVEWGIIGDMLFMQYITGKTPRGFLIKDSKFAKAYEEVFDNLWKIAKK
jgi:HTH-type transcriptional regulator, sugar sensing transcriptional regulator